MVFGLSEQVSVVEQFGLRINRIIRMITKYRALVLVDNEQNHHKQNKGTIFGQKIGDDLGLGAAFIFMEEVGENYSIDLTDNHQKCL